MLELYHRISGRREKYRPAGILTPPPNPSDTPLSMRSGCWTITVGDGPANVTACALRDLRFPNPARMYGRVEPSFRKFDGLLVQRPFSTKARKNGEISKGLYSFSNSNFRNSPDCDEFISYS